MTHILYFSSPFCNICKVSHPAVISAAAYYHLPIEEVNAHDDKNQTLVDKYNIMTLPTIILRDETGELYRTTGAKNVNCLIEDIANII